MRFPTPEQEKQMLDCVKISEEVDGLLMGEPVVQKLCGHVKALLAEIELLRTTIDDVQEQRIDAAVEGSEWKAKALTMYSAYGETPEQYHAGLDKLWKALGITGVQDEDVFTLAARAIEERDRIKEGVRYWSYVMDQGMRKECPEKVEELMDFLISLKIAPYSMRSK